LARAVVLAALLVAAGVASACARPEQSILDQFFTNSRLRDTTALRRFSTVTFEPLQQGTVLDFEISTVVKEEDTKTVTVSAQVKRPDGRVEPTTLIVMMQRRKADDPARATDGEWKITGVIEKAR
jgi:hypothetical protein